MLERHGGFDVFNLPFGEHDVQCIDICFEVLDLAAANDWENVRSLANDIRQSLQTPVSCVKVVLEAGLGSQCLWAEFPFLRLFRPAR